jgi:UDP-N-acetylmuramoylalanine--D-glutamate ligase
MIPSRAFAGQDVAVFGLARTGLASVASLKAGGAHVYAWDDKEEQRAAAASNGASIVRWNDWPWDKLKALILSPGVPLTHPRPHDIVGRANAADVPIIGDFELLARVLRPDGETATRAPLIAVTGTNGKSTTTALIGHVLGASGYDAEIGGNIGKAVLALEPPTAKTIYVAEMSSFQIELAPGLAPDMSILLNLSPDHLDRHGTMEDYARVKERLIRQTAPDGQALVGVDDRFSSAIFTRAAAGKTNATPISVRKVLGRGIFVVDGVLYDAEGPRPTRVMDFATATHLPGAHNWQNAAFAYAATKPFVKDVRTIVSAIESFPGLAHRIEDVGRIGRVRYINDSKATNADAAARALACFPDIFWILGGRPKEGGISRLSPHFSRVRKAYLIGEAAETFAQTLEGKVPFVLAKTLDAALDAAATDAAQSEVPEPVVLLAPACASYDQFQDFEARGDAFRALVTARMPQPVREAS